VLLLNNELWFVPFRCVVEAAGAHPCDEAAASSSKQQQAAASSSNG
jgi:hypothetical protein